MSSKVLVAHYIPRARQRIRELLEGWGYEVLEASDGASAVDQARQSQPDLILLYAPLPRLNAPEACQQIRQLPGFQATPIVIFSDVYRGPNFQKDLRQRFGATDLLAWPVDEDTLRQRVQEWLSGPAPSMATMPVVIPQPLQGGTLDPELERLVDNLLGSEKAPSPVGREDTQEVTLSEPPRTTPVASPEAFRAVAPEAEKAFTDLAKEETSTFETAPSPPPPAIDEHWLEKTVGQILHETLSGLETPAPPPPAAGEAAPVPAEEVEGKPFGPYILLKRIAMGGMAELFVAKKRGVEGFEKTLVIKRILPHLSEINDFITMFIDEARVAARLTHPNIVQIFDMGRIDGNYYIAMEYVPGKDLRALLQRAQELHRPVPIEVAVIVAAHLCAALDYAHRARDDQGRSLHIVHRDVSPPNILISYDGDVKLTDFGVAKAAVKVHVTRIGALKGKILYMAPEQANLQPIDARSDIYSLGIVLYEMLAGRNPFYEEGDTELTVLEKVRQGRVPPIRTFRPDVPEALVSILEKALQPDPNRRYASARELQQALEDFLVRSGIPNSTLYVARFIRELFPEEAGPIDEIQEKLRRLPRGESPPPPSAVEAPSEGAPTVRVERVGGAPLTVKRVPKRLSVPYEPAKTPESTAIQRWRFKTLHAMLSQPRRPTVWFVVIGIALVVLVGIIVGVTLRQTSPRKSQIASAAGGPSPTLPEITPPPPPETSAEGSEAVPPTRETPAEPSPTPTKVSETLPPSPPSAGPRPVSPPTPPTPSATPPPASKTPMTPPTPPATPPPAPETPTTPSTPPAIPPPAPETPPPANSPETEEPPVRPGDLVENPDNPPRILQQVPPDYPPLARAQRLSDRVIIRVLVDERGKVVDTQVLQYKYAILRDAALEAIRKYTFRPARHQGVPVKTWYTVTITFQP